MRLPYSNDPPAAFELTFGFANVQSRAQQDKSSLRSYRTSLWLEPRAEPMNRLYLLGTFRLESAGALARLPRRKTEALVAFLALHPQPHSREQLAALLWGDSSDDAARASLRVELAALRKICGDDLLLADRETVQLNPHAALWVDALEFLAAAPHAQTARIENALDLYRGELLADFYDDWVLRCREQFRAHYLALLLHVTQFFRAQSEYARALEFAQRVLAADPANERAHQHIMFCHLASGDRRAALEQFANCQRALRDELGVAPSADTLALHEWIRQETVRSAAARLTNLPIPLTSFIGRQNETRALKELLTQARLTTLVGVGGSGKTRLAIQVATDLVDQFRDGVWWVALEALNDPARVPQAVATTLGVRQAPPQTLTDTLSEWLGARQLLLALDNCEHLTVSCAQLVGTLLRRCPHLRVLTTSREPLGVTGEIVWQAPPLTLPALTPPTLAHTSNVVGAFAQLAVQYEAVRLFVERATATRRDFQLNDANAPAVIEICRRLDGIPLAIELAAARVQAFTAPEIAARLDERFRWLTGGSRDALPRQQTLRALIDWSYDLLAADERAVFCRLAAFAGSWTWAAAEFVCNDENAAENEKTPSVSSDRAAARFEFDTLARLVSKSLVLSEAHGDVTRYRTLDTLREYARERLQETGQADAIHARHAQFFLAEAEKIEAQFNDTAQPGSLDQLVTIHDNLRAALEWSLERQPETALRLANALGEFWLVRGYWSEGAKWFARVLAQPALAPPTLARATALNRAGMLTLRLREWTTARAAFEAALEIFRALDDREQTANTLSNLGVLASERQDWAHAQARYQEALTLRRALGKPRLIAMTLNNLGVVAKNQGDYAAARAYYAEGLELHRAAGNKQGMMAAHGNLGTLALNQAAYETARQHIATSLALARELGAKFAIAMGTGNLARVALAQNHWAEARALAAQTHALFGDLHDNLNQAAACYDLGYAALREGDLPAAARAYAEGVALARAADAPAAILTGLKRLANLALAQNQPVRAVRWLACHSRACQEINVPVSAFENLFFENDLAQARAQLDDATFAAAWAEGQTQSLEEAINAAQ